MPKRPASNLRHSVLHPVIWIDSVFYTWVKLAQVLQVLACNRGYWSKFRCDATAGRCVSFVFDDLGFNISFSQFFL